MHSEHNTAHYRGPTWEELSFARSRSSVWIEFFSVNGGPNLIARVVGLSDFHPGRQFNVTVRNKDGQDTRLTGLAPSRKDQAVGYQTSG